MCTLCTFLLTSQPTSDSLALVRMQTPGALGRRDLRTGVIAPTPGWLGRRRRTTRTYRLDEGAANDSGTTARPMRRASWLRMSRMPVRRWAPQRRGRFRCFVTFVARPRAPARSTGGPQYGPRERPQGARSTALHGGGVWKERPRPDPLEVRTGLVVDLEIKGVAVDQPEEQAVRSSSGPPNIPWPSPCHALELLEDEGLVAGAGAHPGTCRGETARSDGPGTLSRRGAGDTPTRSALQHLVERAAWRVAGIIDPGREAHAKQVLWQPARRRQQFARRRLSTPVAAWSGSWDGC